MELVQGAVFRKINEMCSTGTYHYQFQLWHCSSHFVNNITRALLLELLWLTNYVLHYVTSDYLSKRHGSSTYL